MSRVESVDPKMDEPAFHTFLGLDPVETSYADARVVLLPVPYDATVSYGGGAKHGPAAIIAASQQIELWDVELGCRPANVGIHLLPDVAPNVAGPEPMAADIEAACAAAIKDDKFVFTLGGEHGVTIGAARAQASRHAELSFLQIDAHLDLRSSYERSPYSHACVAHHLLSMGKLVQVGVRCACEEELALIEQHDLRPFWAADLARGAGDWVEDVVAQLSSDVYVTLDIDGLDPAIMPATGTPVPGGLLWYDTLRLLRAVGERRNVVGCDLVEFAPIGGQQAWDFTAAQLAYKMIGYFVGR
ncbi:MAG: agmatinase [Deltaproteobacteria bacterium]|nr:agmatinase [Deltaproteobacteria bacterium]